MKIKCEICGKELFDRNRLGIHLTRTHRVNLKDYYDTYLKQEKEGICLTCGKPTKFMNLSNGYRKFCCNSCIGQNKDIQTKKKETTKEHFGVEYPMQSKEIQLKSLTTLESNFGVKNAFNVGLEKSKINSHTEEANQKRRISISNTKQKLFKDDTYRQKVIDNYTKNNLQKYGYKWTSQIPNVKFKISESVKNSHVHIKYKYFYDNESFDSSYELAYYIYHKDIGSTIIRKPLKLKYGNHNYTPDFLCNDKLIEIKGNWFFNDKGQLYNPYNKELNLDKQQCMIDNNVEIITDISEYLDYCVEKFNDVNWYRKFKKI